jgi:CheY-like chemotaxis protein
VSDESDSIQGLRGLRVFVAEDEGLVLMLLQELLEDLGCRVVATATNLSGALSLSGAGDFDIAVLDVQLGTEAIDPVVDAVLARGVPLVLATGYDSAVIAERFPRAKILKKPYSLKTLREVLIASV